MAIPSCGLPGPGPRPLFLPHRTTENRNAFWWNDRHPSVEGVLPCSNASTRRPPVIILEGTTETTLIEGGSVEEPFFHEIG
jgi:hypothetical protein